MEMLEFEGGADTIQTTANTSGKKLAQRIIIMITIIQPFRMQHY